MNAETGFSFYKSSDFYNFVPNEYASSLFGKDFNSSNGLILDFDKDSYLYSGFGIYYSNCFYLSFGFSFTEGLLGVLKFDEFYLLFVGDSIQATVSSIFLRTFYTCG